MKAHMKIRLTAMPLALLALLLTLVTQMLLAQNIPLTVGELFVVVKNSTTALSITAVASGNVGGSRCDYYTTTHNYDSRSGSTSGTWYLQQLDRWGCPPRSDSTYFAYGNYTVTIQNHSVQMDYRDADYEDDNGGFGTGYNRADMYVYYNATDGVFYKNDSLTRPITGGYIAVWQDGRKSASVPVKVPATITNSFGGGQVTVDGSSYSAPQYRKWNDTSSHSFAAITPQVYNYLNYGFTGWSDGSSSQSRSITVALSQFGAAYTASFAVNSPQRVTNFWAGGSNGSNPHLTWTEPGNSDVNYYVYRKVRHNGVTGPQQLIATLNHGTSSYDDPDYILVGLSSDLLYYDVRAHHVPSGTFADPFWLCAGYGQLDRQLSPEEPASQSTAPSPTPESYALSAHPNPFNPSTTIQFASPTDGQLKLTVVDVLGREIAVLANGYYVAGYHHVSWDASSAASGIYLARLAVYNELGQVRFSKVEKLLLAK